MLDRELITAIHQSGRRLVGCLAGGGVGGLAAMVATPGASRSVLEGVVPYAPTALADWLGGGMPDQACSEATARAMAMAAWRRAVLLDPVTSVGELVGVSSTASLATDRPKRGEHRIYLGVQSAERTIAYRLLLVKDARSRAEEESLAAALFLAAAGVACGCDASMQWEWIQAVLRGEEQIATSEQLASPAWQRVLLEGEAFVDEGQPTRPAVAAKPRAALFAGAFHPPHAGHLRMAELSEEVLGVPVAWEVSLVNVDKPPLDWISVAERVAGLRAADSQRAIVLSPDATFDRKAARWPGTTFIVGVDTLTRIADLKYYGNDPTRRDDALEQIAGRGCRFLVFGRLVEGRFCGLGDLELPGALRELCRDVDEKTFRMDVSSTALRTGE